MRQFFEISVVSTDPPHAKGDPIAQSLFPKAPVYTSLVAEWATLCFLRLLTLPYPTFTSLCLHLRHN